MISSEIRWTPRVSGAWNRAVLSAVLSRGLGRELPNRPESVNSLAWNETACGLQKKSRCEISLTAVKSREKADEPACQRIQRPSLPGDKSESWLQRIRRLSSPRPSCLIAPAFLWCAPNSAMRHLHLAGSGDDARPHDRHMHRATCSE